MCLLTQRLCVLNNIELNLLLKINHLQLENNQQRELLEREISTRKAFQSKFDEQQKMLNLEIPKRNGNRTNKAKVKFGLSSSVI